MMVSLVSRTDFSTTPLPSGRITSCDRVIPGSASCIFIITGMPLFHNNGWCRHFLSAGGSGPDFGKNYLRFMNAAGNIFEKAIVRLHRVKRTKS
jgi:hypothetical protein